MALARRALFVLCILVLAAVTSACDSAGGPNWYEVEVVDGRVVAIGRHPHYVVAISDDGRTFIEHDLAEEYGNVYSAASNGEVLLATLGRRDESGRYTPVLHSSRDGLAWTMHPERPAFTWRGVVALEGRFVGVTHDAARHQHRVVWSDDGETWRSASMLPAGDVAQVSVSAGHVFATASTGELWVSEDGDHWRELKDPAGQYVGVSWSAVVLVDGVAVATASISAPYVDDFLRGTTQEARVTRRKTSPPIPTRTFRVEAPLDGELSIREIDERDGDALNDPAPFEGGFLSLSGHGDLLRFDDPRGGVAREVGAYEAWMRAFVVREDGVVVVGSDGIFVGRPEALERVVTVRAEDVEAP